MRMLVHLRVVLAEHVNLWRGNAGRLQLFLKDLQIVQAVADEIMP
jgi:hypothetical protein